MADCKNQGFIRIGDIAPDFTCESSEEKELNWHKYIEGKWAILFSHPADFTPVCTTEIGRLSELKQEFDSRGCKVAVVSVDSAAQHKEWIKEINKVSTKTPVGFPILGDETKAISCLYGMLDQSNLDQAGLPLTVRSVFVIGPDKKVKLILTYPASCGRNFDEIIRVLDSLQLTAVHSVVTPADWKQGDDCVVAPNVKGEEAKTKFPDMKVVSESCVLRTTPCPKK